MTDDTELLYQSYLGILVLRAMTGKAKLRSGQDRCDQLLKDIQAAHPEFISRSVFRSPVDNYPPPIKRLDRN